MGAGVTLPVPDQAPLELGGAGAQEHLLAGQLKSISFAMPLNFINLASEAPDSTLADAADIDAYLADLFIPHLRDRDGLLIAIAEPEIQTIERIRNRYTEPLRFAAIDRGAFIAHIESKFRAQLSRDAVFGLADADPQLCARQTITRAQSLVFAAITFSIVAGFLLQPYLASVALVSAMTVGFVANIAFRGLLVWVGAGETIPKRNAVPPICLPGEVLPRYTILVPLYHEANVLPALMEALTKLDYPSELLDVKLIVEEDDEETNRAANALSSPIPFEIVRVPVSTPRTKPKACNYALRFARGEFTVIFDAEDRPEPDQLLKAAAAFRNGPAELGCLQACLNFYNASENWLTRFFALDYSLWFDFLLPGLDCLRVPFPLGGTSNHFRTDVLRSIHGWDSFNVTEDADLGVRLARMGYRASILDSTTYEEATNRFPNWLRQRSRWLKGYMRTSSVSL